MKFDKILFLILTLYLLIPLTVKSENSNIIKLYNEGIRKEQSGELYSALFTFKRVLSENPYFVEAKVALGRVYYKLKDYNKSIKILNESLKLDKNNINALNILGRVYIAVKDYDRAEKIFKRVLELNPANTEARFGLANTYRLKKDYKSAIEEYQYVLKVYPKYPEAYVYLGDTYLDMGKLNKAGAFYRNAVALDSHNPLFHIKLAKYYLIMGIGYYNSDRNEYDNYINAAINEAKTALEIDENNNQALRILGDIYFYRKNYDEAIKYYKDLNQRITNDNLLLYTIGYCYEMNNDLKNAIKYYHQSLSLRRDDEIVRYRLENIVRTLYKTELKNRLRIELSDYHYDKGKYYFNKNFLNKAYFQIKRAIQLDPLNPEKRLFYANILKVQRYYEKYLYELKEIIRDTLDVNTQDINDKIEILENLLSKSLAAKWKVKQYIEDKNSPYYVPKSRMKLAILNSFLPENNQYLHKAISKTFQEMLCYFLDSNPRLKIINPGEEALTPDKALKLAQKYQSDFYITGSFSENSESISLAINLHSTINGEILSNFNTYLTGNDRIFNAFFTINEDINTRLPLFGMIVKIEGDRVLINIGKKQGVKKDMEFIIVKRGEYNPSKNWDLSTIPKNSILGKLKITSVDEMISEGVYEYSGIFNRVNEYDTVVYIEKKKAEKSE